MPTGSSREKSCCTGTKETRELEDATGTNMWGPIDEDVYIKAVPNKKQRVSAK